MQSSDRTMPRLTVGTRPPKLTVVVLCLTALCSVVVAEGTWTVKHSMPDAAHSLGVAAGQDGNVYALGGRSADPAVYLNSARRFEPGSSWSTLPPMPTAREALSAAGGSDGRVYAIGGYPLTGAVEAYDPSLNTWSSVAPISPPRFFGAAATGLDGTIYAIGGRDLQSTLRTVQKYDYVTNQWVAVADLPTGRWNFSAAAGPDGRIYVVGGLLDEPPFLTFQTGLLEVYDPPTNTWSTRATMPTARFGAAAAFGPGGRLFVMGGNVINGGTGFGIVEAYDPLSNTWATLPGITSRYYLGAATGGNGNVYAVGGTANGPDASSLTESFGVHLQSLVLSPQGPRINVGSSQQFIVQGNFSDGTTGPVSSPVSWYTTHINIATITSNGLATGVAPGSTTVWAHAEGIRATATIQVDPSCVVNTMSALAKPTDSQSSAQKGSASGAVDPRVYRALRDSVLSGSTVGQHFSQLYSRHSPEVVRLLLTDSTLRGDIWSGLASWQGVVSTLVSGDKGRVRLTAQQELAVEGVLDRLTQIGSPDLQGSIARERARYTRGRFAASVLDDLRRAQGVRTAR